MTVGKFVVPQVTDSFNLNRLLNISNSLTVCLGVPRTMASWKTQYAIAFGLDSVWHSSFTVAPTGAPTSWFGIQIMGETEKKYFGSAFSMLSRCKITCHANIRIFAYGFKMSMLTFSASKSYGIFILNVFWLLHTSHSNFWEPILFD